MKHCEFCNMELPVNAQFCGNCGRKIADGYATVTDYANPLEMGIRERQTPPLFSSPQHPDLQDFRMGWQDTDSSFQTRWDVEGMEQIDAQFTHRITDENDAVLPDLLLPGMLAMQNQMPSPAQSPMVQGTPQFGAVPSVQGSPVTPGNVPQSIPGPAHGAASSVPSYAPQEAQSIPIHHQQLQYAKYQPPSHYYQPVHLPKPTPPLQELEPHHHHSGSLRKHRTHSSGLHHPAAVSSKAGMSVVSKWLIISIAALVIIGTSSILLAHALMPTTPSPVLIITGSNAVKDGGSLHVHGQSFQPGDGVTLTIDNGLPVSIVGQLGTQATSQGTARNTQVAGLSQMNLVGALQSHSADNPNITVSSTGNFDATVTLPSNLSAGKHTIHARDNQSSLSASLQFTIPAPQLTVNPTNLDFGSVEVGRTVKLLVTLSDQGGANLLWTATVGGSNTRWLALSKNSEVIGTNGLSEPVIVTANTNGLSVGFYTATLRFHTDNADVQAVVKIRVVSNGQSAQQAILNVSPQRLDFGQLQAGQQAQHDFSIANLGNLPLQWQVSSDAGSANWLSLATTKGTVQSGAVPQTVQVNIDTTGLVAGSYSGTIHVTTNGGNAQIGVTLVVTGTTQTLTVTGMSPASGPSTGGTNVMITGTGFTGATSVSFGPTAASNVSVKSDTQITVTSPAGSSIVDVTVTTPAGTSATSSSDQFTYTTTPTTVTVTGITPASGQSIGGTNVTITGKGFSGATGVSFGQTTASKFTVTNDTQITTISPAGSGTIDVTVTTPTGTSATSSSDQFTYTTTPPSVTSISPASGSSTGGANVAITGKGFSGTTGVSFGQTPASNFKIVSDTQILATSPAGSGNVDIIVTAPGGTSAKNSADQFTYIPPPPTITAIKPNSGLNTGGSNVTIVGTGFNGATSVSFGQTVSSVSVISDTLASVTSPPGSGTVDITITTPAGTSKTSSVDQFTYTIPPPTVTGISPTSGLTTGGTNVTITGKGFTGATSVSFGKTTISNITAVSDTQITVTSPPGSGTVDITVTTAGGTSAINYVDQFSYTSPPIN